MKSRMSSNAGQIGLFTSELIALECWKKFPYTYFGENFVGMIAPSLLIRSTSNLQVITNPSQTGLFTSELHALGCQKRHIGRCPEHNLFSIYVIFIKLADNQNMHKLLDKFKTGPHCTICFALIVENKTYLTFWP